MVEEPYLKIIIYYLLYKSINIKSNLNNFIKIKMSFWEILDLIMEEIHQRDLKMSRL